MAQKPLSRKQAAEHTPKRIGDTHTAKRTRAKDEPTRHLIIPDTQVKPGVPTDHLTWIGEAIKRYRPSVIVHLGDHWDFPSLNSHSKPGSAPLENTRYRADVEAGNRAFAQLCKPWESIPEYKPRLEFLCGNHENRADRAAEADPKFFGTVGTNACQVRGFTWNGFLKRVWIDGICYSHYFQSSHSKFPIGGEVSNRLNKIGCSFVQGHEQGARYGNKILASGRTIRGIVAGSCYLHTEEYRGAQGQRHWRGIEVLNGVHDGEYCLMELTLDYLCRYYENMSLHSYMTKKYPQGDWEHLR